MVTSEAEQWEYSHSCRPMALTWLPLYVLSFSFKCSLITSRTQIGGYVARDGGWRWCFWVGAILNAIIFLVVFFCMPETLFDRPGDVAAEIIDEDKKENIDELENISIPEEIYRPPPMELQTYLRRMWLWDLDRPTSRQLKAKDFGVKPLSMLKYPSVVFPVLY